ncbi:hypothetical protein MGYG_07947 [Nannizzia gypsea CBS 118893]|uniref:Uncharacterized protein n=1 Tax=Arthroderma gypseum (strain ATCC MYA-4604 / CBS 118893) TaxID=535722 RepID=E4V4M2_ARTGP|nr:hypothetical protein MGYG_07947 [Nannizzia gypsea CBS 118893]EFR04946.1 hypothetical protein MGYG_07947 [Nannizzia gypsea CBS 118893]
MDKYPEGSREWMSEITRLKAAKPCPWTKEQWEASIARRNEPEKPRFIPIVLGGALDTPEKIQEKAGLPEPPKIETTHTVSEFGPPLPPDKQETSDTPNHPPTPPTILIVSNRTFSLSQLREKENYWDYDKRKSRRVTWGLRNRSKLGHKLGICWYYN